MGALVGLYFVLVAVPSGIGMVTWWLEQKGLAEVSRRRSEIVSLALLIVVGVLLVADLGSPSRFYLMLTRFDNLTSPIALGAKLIALKTALLAVAVYARRRVGAEALAGASVLGARVLPLPVTLDTGLEQLVRTLLGVCSVALAVYPAAVLSWTWSSPLAATSGSALLFVLTAVLLGLAAVMVIAEAGRPAATPQLRAALRTALLAALTCHAVTLLFEGLSLQGQPRYNDLLIDLTSGSGGALFWFGVGGVGILVPAVALLAAPRSRVAMLTAALAAAAGACIARYLLFAVGG